MKITLSNLPEDTERSDIGGLVEEYGDVASVAPLDDGDSDNLEPLVALKEENRAVADKMAQKLNGLNWKGTKIRAQALLFEGGDDPGDP